MNSLFAMTTRAVACSLFLVTLGWWAYGCGTGDPTELRHVDRVAIPERLRRPAPGSRPAVMQPAGTWHVRSTPKRLVVYQVTEAEIAVVLGRTKEIIAMFNRDSFRRLDRLYYSQLPNLEIPLEEIADISFRRPVNRERFFQLDPDVFMVDPRVPVVSWGWSVADVEEVAHRVAPFFGNFIRYRRTAEWGPSYPRYSLDEYTRRFAVLFDRLERYRRFTRFRDRVLRRIRERLPPPDQRPHIAVINIGSEPRNGQFYLVDLREGGNRVRQYRDLGIRQGYDPSAYSVGPHGLVDFETLAAINPQVLVVLWATARFDGPEAFRRRFVEPLRNHPLGRRIDAVQSDRVIPGGIGALGPISHLFQLESSAKLLFPDRFGRWNWGEGTDPLFDRGTLATIVRGDTR